ncbi:MAG TPA: MalY/PatB family protein [Clostridia bacterium]|nr:MalY/PatB family protein [Clostridia bacterium]
MKYDFDQIIDRRKNYSAKYDELSAKFGRDGLLPMWIADMDFQSAKPIVDAIKNRADQGIYGYTSRSEAFYEHMIDWYKRRYGWDIRKDWVIHSPGVVTTLNIILREFTKPGDKIIIQPPVYYPFFDAVRDNDRELVYNPLKKVGENYVMDYEDLEDKIDDKVKYLILCNPHNPVGRVWTKEELLRLGEICIRKNIRVISDEIHGDMVYGDMKYTPFASISEDFNQNSITCMSATKTFNIAGLQSSFAVFPDRKDYVKFEKILGILDIKRNNCFSLVAVDAAYREGEEWLNQLLEYLKGNIEFVIDYCRSNIPKIKPNKPEGTYLVWMDCSELGLDDETLNAFMINNARLAVDGGIWFGKEGSGYVRMNIACPRAVVKEGLERIEKAVNEACSKSFQ